MTILEVNNLSAGYENDYVIRDISFSLEKGEFLSILGKNGSGKSTLIKALQGLLRNISGRISVKSENLFFLSPRQIAQRISYVPQIFSFSFEFSVTETVLMGRYAQRVFIARALAQDTPLLFLDEPSSHLDINYQVEIYQILRQLQEEKGKTILTTEHNINLAIPYSQQIMFLKNGGVQALGPPESLITKKNISEVFGAEVEIRENIHSKLPEISLIPGAGRKT
jgi:iron complex transport system ATP-binding protein